MRVLVTGGGGFIGSHLVERLVSDGATVVVIDDFSTGSRRNLAGIDPTRLTVVEARVQDAGVIDDATVGGIDLVFHLAAAVGVFEILRRPLECLRTNLDAAEAVFEWGSRDGIRTVFTSTSEVYGKNGKDRLHETDDSVYGPTTARRWLYAVSKATDEFMALASHREAGLPVSIARLFNTIGPRQTGAYGMVVPRLVEQALTGRPLTVYGDGRQTRCFTNVHDAVEALVRIAATPATIGQVVNVGQPSEITIRGLAELIKATTDSPSPVELVPYAEAYEPGFEDMQRRAPDVALLRELTGFAPDTPLAATIDEIVAWMRGELGMPGTPLAAPA
ncbi:MAG TPA: NAD-dependent epimerase/dehydratase family protein [Candidatus Limnocylindrales bacterium]|nr:NAD-dependent epimerase/dehydratase family protein [Candidatus Limnocylindrales bacterium]